MTTFQDIGTVRHYDLYGDCRDINLVRGGEVVGTAHRTVTEVGPTWFISVWPRDCSLKHDPNLSIESNCAAVELTLRLMGSLEAEAA